MYWRQPYSLCCRRLRDGLKDDPSLYFLAQGEILLNDTKIRLVIFSCLVCCAVSGRANLLAYMHAQQLGDPGKIGKMHHRFKRPLKKRELAGQIGIVRLNPRYRVLQVIIKSWQFL